MSSVVGTILTLFILHTLVALQPSPHDNTRQSLLQRVHMLAYRGDVDKLRVVFTEHGAAVSAAIAGEERTPVHSALQGRHESLSYQSLQLRGRHEDAISFLLDSADVSADQGCPLYYALHYRNMNALKILITHSDMERSLVCLTSLDSTGRTALHSAVKSKASGFARFFAKFRHENPDPQVLELLGLHPLQGSTPDTLTATELNSATTHTDIELILTHWPALNLSAVVDHRGNTLLHGAAYSGRVSLVEMLIKTLDVNAENDLGLTPLHLAYAGYYQDIAAVLSSHGALDTSFEHSETVGRSVEGNEGVCFQSESNQGHSCLEKQSTVESSEHIWWQKYLNSGWANSDAITTNAREVFAAGCKVVTRNGVPVDEFMSEFYGGYRPVVLQGMMDGWPAWDHWTKDSLIAKYGELVFTVSGVPYASLYYGAEAHTSQTTLRDFLRTFNETLPYPNYIFDGQILHRHPELSQDTPLPPPSFSSALTVSLKQLIVGPRGSGSPPHFHRHVLNALVYGVKRWFLWPPSSAHFVFRHVQDWYADYSSGEGLPATGPAVECVQRPGDVFYVPENWGHAVLNLQDSIAVAYEFE